MKIFNLPLNDERIQTVTEEQVDLMLWADLYDDPERVEALNNRFYDPDYSEDLDEDELQQNRQNLQQKTKEVSTEGVEDDYEDEFLDLTGKSDNTKDDEWQEV